jgi:hypothetical protein
MAITSYSGLLTELTRLIDGEDVSASEIPAATLAQIIHFGELKIYREIRTRFNEKAWGITVTSNLAPLPADFIAPSVIHFGKSPLDPKSEAQILQWLNESPSSGDCLYFCHAGANLQFYPAVANATAVQGRYYYKLPDLDVATLPTNTLFAAAEDLFLYAALAESAPFFGQDARLPMWMAKYEAIKKMVNVTDHRAAFGVGRIVRSNSTRGGP